MVRNAAFNTPLTHSILCLSKQEKAVITCNSFTDQTLSQFSKDN